MTNEEKRNLLNTEKNNLLEKVASLDYRRLKNSEASLAGMPLPYDPVALYQESQSYRDRINEIEAELPNLPDPEPTPDEPAAPSGSAAGNEEES